MLYYGVLDSTPGFINIRTTFADIRSYPLSLVSDFLSAWDCEPNNQKIKTRSSTLYSTSYKHTSSIFTPPSGAYVPFGHRSSTRPARKPRRAQRTTPMTNLESLSPICAARPLKVIVLKRRSRGCRGCTLMQRDLQGRRKLLLGMEVGQRGKRR